MSTQRVLIESDYPLEGIVHENARAGGVVICHPHPLYGGSMFNNVVEAMEDGFGQKGVATLRFNFRGVGASGGEHDNGDGEVADVRAAAKFLQAMLEPGAPLMFAGYSFGAWVCSRAAATADIAGGVFLVSYPFGFYPADPLFELPGPFYFVGGTYDEIGPVEELVKVYKALPVINKHLKVIPTDHFYGGKDAELAEFIAQKVQFPF